ncbi:glycine cleavage system protein GcvH [bacterium]|nr:glycine cleavage system protein GcvH [bacterium]MBU1983305.1 glycine cleavage system protein GcvH [bacterium]
MNIPKNLLYSKDHEWVQIEGDVAIVGITDFAQGELGDVVFVQLPDGGFKAEQGKAFGTIEAVKAVADVYAPLSGEVIEVNSTLADKPELMNQDPYGKGWMVKIKTTNLNAERSTLLDPAAYTDLTSA